MGRELRCELCGNEFRCRAPGPCWCSGIRLTSGQRNLLSSTAGDCVCPDCLEKASRVK